MNLLKEAIFDKEEIEFIEMMCNRAASNSEELADEVIKYASDDPMIKMLIKVGGDNEIIKKGIKEHHESLRKKVYEKAKLARNILTKMSLYKNSMLNND